jgi:hypothetical protein
MHFESRQGDQSQSPIYSNAFVLGIADSAQEGPDRDPEGPIDHPGL